jgi:hypothetical protein
MQIKGIAIGDKWACVTVTDIGKLDDEQTGPYSEYPINSNFMSLLCDCGQEFIVTPKNWLGKRKILDCGCGVYDPEDHMPMMLTISIPLRDYRGIKQMVKDNETNLNALMRKIIKAYLYGENLK